MAPNHPTPNAVRGSRFLDAVKQLTYSQLLAVCETHSAFEDWPFISMGPGVEWNNYSTEWQRAPIAGNRKWLKVPPPTSITEHGQRYAEIFTLSI